MLYPLLFRPILKPRVWGGTRLVQLGKPIEGVSGDVPIGESWEVADLPPEIEDGQSIIANGSLAGMTLHEAITTHGRDVLGSRFSVLSSTAETPATENRKPITEIRFPLLIKYLDAQESLSVQVHPDRAYAEKHPEAHLKDEAWIVIDCAPGAVIYKGLKEGLDEKTLRAHIASGEIVNDLIAVPVSPGECHYLPSGTVHALGAGVMVAEVQTPSDTTFRMYDWGRTSRQMHVDEAMEVIFDGNSPQSPGIPVPGSSPGAPMIVNDIKTTFLLTTDHFSIERIEALDDAAYTIVTNEMPEVWMVLDGSGAIAGDTPVQLATGTTALIPAALPETQANLRKITEFLRITLPSPLAGMIA